MILKGLKPQFRARSCRILAPLAILFLGQFALSNPNAPNLATTAGSKNSKCEVELSGNPLAKYMRPAPVLQSDRNLWLSSLTEQNVEMFDVKIFSGDGEVIFETRVGGSVLTAIDYPGFKKIVDEALIRAPNKALWTRVILNHTHQYPCAIFDWFPKLTNRLFGNFRSEFSREDDEFVLGAKALLDLMGFEETTLEFGVVYPKDLGRPSLNSRLGKTEYTLEPSFNFQSKSFFISDRVAHRLKEWQLLPK